MNKSTFTPPTFTPGPWFRDDSMHGRISINSERASVATIPYTDRESKANALLIAAAPELLAVLKRCLAVMEHRCPEASPLPDVRFVIAKAEGRS